VLEKHHPRSGLLPRRTVTSAAVAAGRRPDVQNLPQNDARRANNSWFRACAGQLVWPSRKKVDRRWAIPGETVSWRPAIHHDRSEAGSASSFWWTERQRIASPETRWCLRRSGESV